MTHDSESNGTPTGVDLNKGVQVRRPSTGFHSPTQDDPVTEEECLEAFLQLRDYLDGLSVFGSYIIPNDVERQSFHSQLDEQLKKSESFDKLLAIWLEIREVLQRWLAESRSERHLIAYPITPAHVGLTQPVIDFMVAAFERRYLPKR